MFKAICAVLLVVFTLPAKAVTMPMLPDNLTVFSLADADRFRSSSVSDYRLILGSVIKIDRQVRSDLDERLKGELQQFTWEIPRNHSPEEGFTDLRNQLVERGAQLLYQCQGRECGASNIWANDLFRYSTLYGRDDSQHYLAAQLNGNHYAIYAVRRGNQRIYLHMDLLLGDNEADQAWFLPLETQGYVILPNWPEAPELAVEQLADWMQEHPGTVRLVVHQAGTDTKISFEKSLGLASALRQNLINAGIAPERLDAQGAGNLVPSVLGAREQVAVAIYLLQ